MSKSSDSVISATELKNNLGKYLDMTTDKKEFVITKNNKKIARLTPYITQIEAYFAVKEKAHDYVFGGKKVSYDEFMQIYENSTQRMEYLNEEIFLLPSPTSFHQDVLGSLYILFNSYFSGVDCKVYLAPFNVRFYKKDLSEPDVLQPDITVACDYKDTIDKNGKYTGTPSLVVEILSESTRSRDMVDKLNTYMLSGVREYWIVDIKNKRLYIYNFKDYSVEVMKSFATGDDAVSINYQGLRCNVKELFENISP